MHACACVEEGEGGLSCGCMCMAVCTCSMWLCVMTTCVCSMYITRVHVCANAWVCTNSRLILLIVSWTTIEVHSKDVEDCSGSKNQLEFLHDDVVVLLAQKAFRSILNAFKKTATEFWKKNYLMEFSTDWLTDWCLQISVPQQWLVWFFTFDIASAQEMPFGALLFIQCILTSALLCIPFIFAHHKVSILW